MAPISINYTFMKGLSLGFGSASALLYMLSFFMNNYKYKLRLASFLLACAFLGTSIALKAQTIKVVDRYELKNQESTFDEDDIEMVKYIKNIYWIETLSMLSIVFFIMSLYAIAKK